MAQIEYKVLQYPEGIHWAHTAVTSAPNPSGMNTAHTVHSMNMR